MHDLTRNLLAALRFDAGTRHDVGPVRRVAVGNLAACREEWEEEGYPDADDVSPAPTIARRGNHGL